MVEEIKPMSKEEIINLSMEIIEKGTALLTDDEETKKYFEETLKSLKNAQELIDGEEKQARMQDAAVKFANQLCFLLFRHNVITQELTDYLRALPSPEETSKVVAEFSNDRDARIKALTDAHSKIMDEQKELDLFLGVISGLTKEEALRRMQEHDDQVKAQLKK